MYNSGPGVDRFDRPWRRRHFGHREDGPDMGASVGSALWLSSPVGLRLILNLGDEASVRLWRHGAVMPA